MSKILVADDSPELLDLLKALLEKSGYEVRTALYRYSIMNLLEDFKPDVILLDVMLRANDGRELCKELKHSAAYKNLSVILMSACADYLKNYKECEADAVIEKPFSNKEVINTLDLVLSHHQINVNPQPINAALA